MLLPGNLDVLSQTLGSPVVLLVCAGGFVLSSLIISWARVVYEPSRAKNLAFDFGRNTFTLSESMAYADLTDCREILPEHSRDNDKPKGVGKF